MAPGLDDGLRDPELANVIRREQAREYVEEGKRLSAAGPTLKSAAALAFFRATILAPDDDEARATDSPQWAVPLIFSQRSTVGDLVTFEKVLLDQPTLDIDLDLLQRHLAGAGLKRLLIASTMRRVVPKSVVLSSRWM